jgi:hypothetical protein
MISLIFVKKKLLLTCSILLLTAAACWLWSLNAGTQRKSGTPVAVSVQKTRESTQRNTVASPVNGQDFFVESRQARDRINSRKIELDQEIAANPASSTTARDASQQDIMKVMANMGVETELERLIIGRGYQDAVVVIQDKASTAVIQSRAILPDEVDKIGGIISRATGLDPGSITVISKP